CAVPFRSTFQQRPISIARYCADGGATVLFTAWQFAAGDTVPADGEELYPRIFHLPLAAMQAHAGEIAAASGGPGVYLCTLPDPRLVETARSLRAGGYHIHYDIMDDWEEFHRAGEAPWYALAGERELVTSAASLSAVSETLARKFAGLRHDIAVVPNGYDPLALACPQF